MKISLDGREPISLTAEWLMKNFPNTEAAKLISDDDGPTHVLAAMLVDELFIGRVEIVK